MDANAVLLYNGLPVKMKSGRNGYDFTNNYRLSNEGLLLSFEANGREYFFLQRAHLFLEDLQKKLYQPGYYDRESYNKYRKKSRSGEIGLSLIELTQSAIKIGYTWEYGKRKPNLGFEQATEGDLVVVRRLSPRAPFIEYYQTDNYYFKIPEGFSGRYTSISDFPPTNLNPNSPDYSELKQESNDIPHTRATYHFYKRNFGDHIQSAAWNGVPETVESDKELDLTVDQLSRPIISKKGYATYVTLIGWRIAQIIDEILPKIALTPLQNIETIYLSHLVAKYKGITPDPNQFEMLPLSDQAIGILLHSWGQLDTHDSTEPFEHIQALPTVPSFDYKDKLRRYRQTLYNFYMALHFLKKEDMFPPDASLSQEEEEERRLITLLTVLPLSAVQLLSKEIRFKILKKIVIGQFEDIIAQQNEGIRFMTAPYPVVKAALERSTSYVQDITLDAIPYATELLVIKILESVSNKEEANYFLDNLMSNTIDTAKGKVPMFQRMYFYIADKNDGFLIAADNRKRFITRLYILWYISDYNPINSNPNILGDQPTDYDATEELYNSYNEAPIFLDYNSEKTLTFYPDNMNFSFKGNKIHIEKDTGIISNTSIGTYDYYQAISLRDIRGLETAIRIPAIAVDIDGEKKESAILPLFFLKYMDDYGDKDDTWTAINATLDIAFTFVGVGNLTKLRHLRHLSKLRHLFESGGLGAVREGFILSRPAVTGVFSVIEISASVGSMIIKYHLEGCNAYREKVKENINDDNEKGKVPNSSDADYNFCRELDVWLFLLQLSVGLADTAVDAMLRASSRKIVKMAPDSFQNLEAGVPFNLMRTIAGNLDDMRDAFQLKLRQVLGQVPGKENSRLWDEFKLLSDDDQHAFLINYQSADDGVLKRLYKTENEASLIEEWKILKTHHLLPENIENLELLRKVENKFIFNDKTGREGLQAFFEGHEAPQSFLNNLKKADEQYGGLDGLTFSGSKPEGACLITTKNIFGDELALGKIIRESVEDNLIDAWKVLQDHPNLLIEDNLNILAKTESKFLFDGTASYDGFKQALDGHVNPQQFINNLGRADELYGDLPLLTFTGSKTSADCKLLELSDPPYPEIELGTITNGVVQSGSLMEGWKICLGIVTETGRITNPGWRRSEELLTKIMTMLDDPVVAQAIRGSGTDVSEEFSKILRGLQDSPCRTCTNVRSGNLTMAPIEDTLNLIQNAITKDIRDYSLRNITSQLKISKVIPEKNRGWLYELEKVVQFNETFVTTNSKVSYGRALKKTKFDITAHFDMGIDGILNEMKSTRNIRGILYNSGTKNGKKKINQLIAYFGSVNSIKKLRLTFDARALKQGYLVEFERIQRINPTMTEKQVLRVIAKREMKEVINEHKRRIIEVLSSRLRKRLRIGNNTELNDKIINDIVNKMIYVD